MTEGPHYPLLLAPDETDALHDLLEWLDAVPLGQRIVVEEAVPASRAALRAALERAAPGTMQTLTHLPVHARRAGGRHPEHGTALPVCDVSALGVISADRNLIDCVACIALLDEALRHPCPLSCNDGFTERTATPAEVDAGLELGVAFDPCPACNPSSVQNDLAADIARGVEHARPAVEAAVGTLVGDVARSMAKPIEPGEPGDEMPTNEGA